MSEEPVISVTVDQDRVVLRPVGVLDDELAETLVRLLAGARAAGAAAVVDFTQADRERTPA